jgi:group II intron reverse transcriptase/maturase
MKRLIIVEERTPVTVNRREETRMLTQESGLSTSTTKLMRIVESAKRDKTRVWNNLFHALDVDLFKQSFHDLPKDKAVGADGIDKLEYGTKLDSNIKDLVLCIRKGTYIPKAARIIEIPKTDGSTRPLAISCFEDKIVQKGLKEILEAIYEPKFLDCSHGFRPKRGADTALPALNKKLFSRDCGAVIDIDLKSFFNSIPHDKLIDLIKITIMQPDFIHLIVKIMRTPYLDDKGKAVDNLVGVPQGSIVSPVLANIFLHYVIDVWMDEHERSGVYGKCSMTRYADDAIFVFENMDYAEKFMMALKERLLKFGIELNVNKTKMTPYGSGYAAQCYAKGCKPPIFRFLGFVHYFKKSYNRFTGKPFWRPAVKSCPIRMRKKFRDIYQYIKKNRHKVDLIKKATEVMNGLAGYFCVNDNIQSVIKLSWQIRKALFKWLNKRSQRGMNWDEFNLLLKKEGYPMRFKVKNLFYTTKV